MMRIGVLTTSYPRAPGDPAGGFVAGLARWLARCGHIVEVVAAAPGDSADGDIRVHRVAAGASLFYDEGAPERLERGERPLRAPLFTIALAARAASAARRGRWDRVLSHWLLPAGVAAATLRVPHLAVAHSGDVHLAARPALADALGAALLARRARVGFVAAHLRARLLRAMRVPALREALAARSFVCPMGVDVAPRPAPPEGPPLVLFLGRLVPIKGLDALLAAMERVRRERPDARLVVAGDGPLRARLRGPGVDLAGEVRGAARDALLHRAHALVVPSVPRPDGRTEGAPVAAAEALAAGVPLVASDLPGLRELAGEGAFYAPPGDVCALAAAILAALAATPPQPRADLRWDAVGPLWERAMAALPH